MSNWSVIGAAWDDESVNMMKLIEDKTGCQPKYFASYSTIRAFILHAGLDANHPVAYKDGNLVGTYEKVKKFLE